MHELYRADIAAMRIIAYRRKSLAVDKNGSHYNNMRCHIASSFANRPAAGKK